ncbi:hypothetical protein FXE80_01455 [Vibrio cholerae]|uniref:hypothetical protein n=1 Tax=Vibrio cholerae TaxID=666 RepID=UPI0011DB101C|nr:hypothetical protein [Vibrio cholerae]TXY78051.1 hypothetical protein FXE80_01455 [Vibrio cholerae]GIB17038.1 hypothetical protein VCSRO90_2879 [Vibrio cholerae]
MQLLRQIWWSIASIARGMTYQEYLDFRLAKAKKEYDELPDTPNFLSMVRENYGLKSLKRTIEMLLFMSLVACGLMIFGKIIGISMIDAITYFIIIQCGFFVLGVFLNYKYKKN